MRDQVAHTVRIGAAEAGAQALAVWNELLEADAAGEKQRPRGALHNLHAVWKVAEQRTLSPGAALWTDRCGVDGGSTCHMSQLMALQ